MAEFKSDVPVEQLEYLDTLRESGETNMFGAALYLQDEFGLTRQRARQVLTYWMETWEERWSERQADIREAERDAGVGLS